MAKITWGGVSKDALNEQEGRQFRPYDGPPVPDGVYCFKIKWMRASKSSKGNDQLALGMELVPRQSRPDEKPFAGFFVTDYIPVMDSTAFRLRPLLDALGVSVDDFYNRTDVERSEQKNILRIGKTAPVGKYVLAQVATGADQKGAPRREVAAGGYWEPVASGAKQAEPEPDDADGGAEGFDDPPF